MRSHSFKFSGLIGPDDRLHRVIDLAPQDLLVMHEIAPKVIPLTITSPGPTRRVGVPQYAPTVVARANGFDPSGDCEGNFMSSRFQPNNNCYAYGCNIATNTFPQPGRAKGNQITPDEMTGRGIQALAEQDGLVFAGHTMAELRTFAADKQGGHYVALLISAPEGEWTGDYHWVRCDDSATMASWSQKDGADAVTNFDFAGKPILDPTTATWAVNQGPSGAEDAHDLIIDYDFFCFMHVPAAGVTIL